MMGVGSGVRHITSGEEVPEGAPDAMERPATRVARLGLRTHGEQKRRSESDTIQKL